MAMRPTRDHRPLHRAILRGEAGKKVLFQPRIDCWYHDRIFRDKTLQPPYEGLSRHDLYCTLDVSPRLYEFNACFESYDLVPVERTWTRLSPLEVEQRIVTPVGTVSTIHRQNDSNGGSYYKTWLAEDEEQVKILTWIENNTMWRWNQATYERLLEEWDGLGLPTMFMPRVNLQHALIDTMGVEGTIYALADFPEVMEEYFAACDARDMRLIEVINASPIECINFGDNLHGGITPPYLFERYVLPAYLARNEALHRAGKFTHSHWDGDCKALLPFARRCGLDGIEAITPVPQGDVTIDEIKEALGDEVFLIDGIPAILFDDIYPEQLLLDTVKELIDKFAPRLILGISDEMSSTGNIERIKLVRDYVDAYNASLE